MTTRCTISTRDRPTGTTTAGSKDVEKLLCVDHQAAELHGKTTRFPLTCAALRGAERALAQHRAYRARRTNDTAPNGA